MTVAAAQRWARKQVGTTESPAGSNRVKYWTYLRSWYGVRLSGNPWCGAFVICCARAGGLKLPWRFVSVAWAEDWARARDRWTTDTSKARAGDAVVCFGRGVHIEWVSGDAGYLGVPVTGGNTSEAGSQSNGGQVVARIRPHNELRGVIRLAHLYPRPPKPTLTRTLKVGMRGADVRAWRKVIGQTTTGPTGNKFTAVTARKTRKWRKAHGLGAGPGAVGPAAARKAGWHVKT